MENKEITLLDLVKIAARWIWVLVIGAVVCAAVAFFYSTQVVTPLYSSGSKFVIQTKGQSSESDVLESQRTVAYAQLAVGTYIDIVNTKNFAEEIAFYMNGNVKEQSLTQNAINALICRAILIDNGIKDTVTDENGNVTDSELRLAINDLADAGLIAEGAKKKDVKTVVKERMLLNNEKSLEAQGLYTKSQKEAAIEARLEYETLIEEIIDNGDFLRTDLYSGDTPEKIDELKAVGLGEGKVYKGNAPYTMDGIKSKMSFSPAKEESTTFDLKITSTDPEEAYAIARVCEIVIADYVEALYPGIGFIKAIEDSKLNYSPINNNVLLMTLIGFIGGFLLAFVVVYIVELSDNRIKNETELSEKTGLSVVGIIPDMNDDKGNMGYYYYSYGRNEQ